MLALVLCVGARPTTAGAEGTGYDGAGSGLRVRVIEASASSDATDSTSDTGATGSPDGTEGTGAAAADTTSATPVLEVRGSGFLANSAVTVRVAGGGAVRASADEVGSVVARLHLRSKVGGRVWVTATGTDPSFQRRVVTDHLAVGSGGSPVSPTTLVLGAVAACVVASIGVGMARRRPEARAGTS